MVGIPLLVKDRVVGVFHVGTFRSRQFTSDDVLLFVADCIKLALST